MRPAYQKAMRCAFIAVVLGASCVGGVRCVVAQDAALELIIAALFGDAEDPNSLDANGDGRLSVADMIAVVAPAPTATQTFMATDTPTPTSTPMPQPTTTPTGLLFGGTTTELVPHAVGDTFVYILSGSDTGTETDQIISADAGGNFVVDIQHGSDHQTETYLDTGSRILFVGPTDVVRRARTTCQPPLVRLASPVIVGQMFSTTSLCELHSLDNNSYLGHFQLTETFKPVELVASVTVPAGTYTGVVHGIGTRSVGQETDDIYIAPGIGIVRGVAVSTDKGTVTRELTDGTVGGHTVRR